MNPSCGKSALCQSFTDIGGFQNTGLSSNRVMLEAQFAGASCAVLACDPYPITPI